MPIAIERKTKQDQFRDIVYQTFLLCFFSCWSDLTEFSSFRLQREVVARGSFSVFFVPHNFFTLTRSHSKYFFHTSVKSEKLPQFAFGFKWQFFLCTKSVFVILPYRSIDSSVNKFSLKHQAITKLTCLTEKSYQSYETGIERGSWLSVNWKLREYLLFGGIEVFRNKKMLSGGVISGIESRARFWPFVFRKGTKRYFATW